MIDVRLIQRLTTEQAIANLVDMTHELRRREASVVEQKEDIKTFLRCVSTCKRVPWITRTWHAAAVLIVFCLVSSCRAPAPKPARLTPPPPAEARGLASLSWPSLSGAEAYRVDYGVGASVAEMTNSLVTGATNCIIPDLTAGQRYLFQVRGIVVNQFGQLGKTYSKPITFGVFKVQ